MIGKVAECPKQHRLGVICAIKIDVVQGLTIYQGIGFDGKAWESSNPKVKAACLNEYIKEFYITPVPYQTNENDNEDCVD